MSKLVVDSVQHSSASAANLSLTSTGRVGIGITSPSYQLQVYNGSGAVISYVGSGGSTSNDYGLSYIYGGSHYLNAQCYGTGYGYYCGSASQNIQYGNYANAPITFITNNTERAQISATGDFKLNSGYGSSATVYGVRAWCKFDGTGTAAISGSGNISSITDNGTGDYTFAFTNAMPDTNYALAFAGLGLIHNGNGSYWTTSSIRILTMHRTDSYSLNDAEAVSISVIR